MKLNSHPIVLLIVGGIALASCGSQVANALSNTPVLGSNQNCSSSQAKLTVNASGDVKSTPDQATLYLGVSTIASTAVKAINKNNSETSTVISSLVSNGVSIQNIQTASITLSPNYSSSGNIIGYSASNSLNVTVTSISNTGNILDAVTSAGGNSLRIQTVSFSISDPTSLNDQARVVAVEKAKNTAQQIASALSETVVGVCSVSDASPVSNPYPIMYNAASNVAGSVPVEPGTQITNVQENVTFAIASK